MGTCRGATKPTGRFAWASHYLRHKLFEILSSELRRFVVAQVMGLDPMGWEGGGVSMV